MSLLLSLPSAASAAYNLVIMESREPEQGYLDSLSGKALQQIGEDVVTLVSNSTAICAHHDEEYGFSLTVLSEEKPRVHVQQFTVADLFAAALGRGVPSKFCFRCRTEKPLGQFAVNGYCLECERKRVADYREKHGRRIIV